MKKINCIKILVIYVENNSVVVIKNILKFEITIITQENIGALHIISIT